MTIVQEKLTIVIYLTIKTKQISMEWDYLWKKWNKQFKILGMCQPSLCVSINYYYKLNFVNRV